jgi:hypothetical protein
MPGVYNPFKFSDKAMSTNMRSKLKRLLASLFLTLGLLVSHTSADQPASKIIDRFKKASGGKAATRLKSTLMTGAVKAADGSTGRFSYQISAPNNLRIDIEMAGSKISECYNGKSAWRMDSRGLRTLLGDEAKRLRLEALLSNNRLNDLKRNRIVPQSIGKTTIDGKQAAGVELTWDAIRVKLFFDASTNLLMKREREVSEGIEETFYGDYRNIDGVMEPFSLRIKKGNDETVVSIDHLEHNRPFELAAFRYPQVEGSRPLPELEPLLKALNENQDKIDEMRERYTCRLVEIERKHDGDGRIKESETKTYEVTPIGSEFVERLMSVNGRELSSSEREKEDKRVQKEIEEILKKTRKEATAARARPSQWRKEEGR